MRLVKTAIFISLLVTAELPAGESLKVLPELLEWGLTGAVFVGARKLDHIPVWSHAPFFKGTADEPYYENTVTETELYVAAGLTVLGIGFVPNNDGWLKQSNYHHTQGFIEALSAVYLLTNVTKNLFGRQRPSFLNYPREDYLDADKSFPSGHTSISFAIASYSSLYVFDYIGRWGKAAGKNGKLLYFTTSHLLAGFVGYTRIADNRHFLSDVIAGGLLGSGVAMIVYSFQNRQTDSNNENSSQTLEIPLQLTFSIPF